jgi:uncharacterized membrane protein YwzB
MNRGVGVKLLKTKTRLKARLCFIFITILFHAFVNGINHG